MWREKGVTNELKLRKERESKGRRVVIEGGGEWMRGEGRERGRVRMKEVGEIRMMDVL